MTGRLHLHKTVTVEIEKLADVLASVDNYCGNCQASIAEEMDRLVPGIPWYALIMEAEKRHDAAIESYRAANGLPKVP